ncbi:MULTISPECIES: hypothetical protein [Streptococcus anginosus group]|uniref:hypothetical protein n=1 Tax=Streptococcus anginosus group TaxID=671232 RepID=UPI00189BC11A|nr:MULTISPECIES: hypothetical protein [Streptococcus anginosus group]HEN2308656.1 hypothetical protein [Streptococcus agalactiae]
MIGSIRIIQNGNSKELAQVDLLRFNEEAIRQRLVDKGYPYDSELVVAGISDWNIDTNLNFQEIRLLKLCYEELYDHDEYIISFLLQHHWKVLDVISVYYKFASKNEVEALSILFKDYEKTEIIRTFYHANNWINCMQAYLSSGELLNTPNGFYRKVG